MHSINVPDDLVLFTVIHSVDVGNFNDSLLHRVKGEMLNTME